MRSYTIPTTKMKEIVQFIERVEEFNGRVVGIEVRGDIIQKHYQIVFELPDSIKLSTLLKVAT